jgi:hypothetical protein
MQEQREHVGGGGVGPVNVVQQDSHGARPREQLEQHPNGARHVVPSVGGRRWLDARHPRDRWHNDGERGEVLVVEPGWRITRQMAVERVRPKREGQIALELGGAPPQARDGRAAQRALRAR